MKLRKNNSVYLHNLFEYFIHYQWYIKVSIIFLSINSICMSYFTISILWDMKLVLYWFIKHGTTDKWFRVISFDKIFANVLNSEDFTYKSLKSLIQNQNIVILQGDKDSSLVIIHKSDYT